MNWSKGGCKNIAQQTQPTGSLIGSSGLRKVAGLPGSSFEIVVLDRRGRPVSHLSEWYRRRHEPGPNRTRQPYLGMLFPGMGFFCYYPYPSPMTSQLLEQWRRERGRMIGSSGAPDHAGIRSEAWEESRRHPIAYFRQGKRKPWQPKMALESTEVRERMGEALIYMTHHAPTQRDKVVLLLLRHTGARLHEILGMTAGGYRKAAGPLNALVVNKGSLGREEKLITFLDTDEVELLKYIREERAQYDPLGRTQLADLHDADPLFLTARRKPYADAAFRYHWNCLMEQVQRRYQVFFTPHAIRHLFVTQHLVWIKEEAGDDREEQQRLKAGLIQIMGWHSRETMRIYDHTFSIQEAVQKLHEFQRKAEHQAIQAIATSASLEPNLTEEREVTIIEESEPLNTFAQLWEELV